MNRENLIYQSTDVCGATVGSLRRWSFGRRHFFFQSKGTCIYL